MAWWDWILSPHEAAFSRAFDAIRTTRDAVRAGFQANEAAKTTLAEFHAAFSELPAGSDRSAMRRKYQDMLGATNETNSRLESLSLDLATLQGAASSAQQGSIPYEILDGEIAVRNIVLHAVTEEDIQAATGVGGVAVVFVVLAIAGAVAAVMWNSTNAKEQAIGIAERSNALSRNIARMQVAMGVVPRIPSAVADPSNLTAGVSIVALGLIGLGGLWLAKRA